MSVEQRGGRWRARVRRGGQHHTATFATSEEADAWRATVVAALTTGKEPPAPPRAAPVVSPPRPVTVAEACHEFVRGMVTGTVRTRSGRPYKPSTIRGHENRLRLHVLPTIGLVPITGLRRGDVRRLVEQVAAQASPTTALHVRDALRIVLQRQVDLEVLEANPAAGVRAAAGGRGRARFLTAEEADHLQAVADRHRNPGIGALVGLGLGTGLRPGEIQALAWGPDGLDLDRRIVGVRATLDRTGLVEPKSGRRREVPLGPDLVARMLRYRMATGRPPDGERVFPQSLRRAWVGGDPPRRKDRPRRLGVRDEAGFPNLRLHDLRHTCATFWLAAGLTVHAVAELLGHVDAGLVLRLYGHALPREVASAAERLEAWREAQRG